MTLVEGGDNRTDEEIVRLVKNGDKESFGLLMERYEAKMRRYARRFLFESVTIDDLVQEVFVKTYVNLQGFDDSKRFSPWIYRIAHNEFVNALRKKLTEKIFPIDFDTFLPHLEAEEKSDRGTEAGILKDVLEKHLQDLDPKYREPLLLYFFEEMDYKDIAFTLGVPVSTVGVRIKRGKEKLRQLLLNNKVEYGG